MPAPPESLTKLLRDASGEIVQAQRTIRVLATLAWGEDVERRFFAERGRELPRPGYKIPVGLGDAVERMRALKARLSGDNEVERFLRDVCEGLSTAGRMMMAVGTKEFYFHSVELYGRPASLSSDRKTTNLDLARHFDDVLAGFGVAQNTEADELVHSSEETAEELGRRLRAFFTGRDVKVTLSDTMAANAAAGFDEVRLKAGVRFSARDIRQLEVHEGHVHMATAWNGRQQAVCKFFGYPVPRSTRTQEGLAVLTEFMAGAASFERLRRLSDRTLAIQMAEDGGDFLDLYRFFRERGHGEQAAFDCARRVCRGGLVEGGAPFTKDICYLDGLLRVTNFLRVAMVKGRADFLGYLFAGKLDVEDVPVVARLAEAGLVTPPTYVPRWVRDLPTLTAFMSYAAFLGETDLPAERMRFDDRVARAAEPWSSPERGARHLP